MTTKNNPFQELEKLIGLRNVKKQVSGLASRMRIDQARREHGLKVKASTHHLLFAGNPGTGKTTVARIIADIVKELGVLSKGHLVEVQRSDLVAGYIGQTAEKTRKVLERALDGVLFIDEAYTLASHGSENDFGREAIAEILTAMENYGDRLIVIAAGYPDEMEKFTQINPGLASRFRTTIEFEDYTGDELFEIFELLAYEHDYRLNPAGRSGLRRHLADLHKNREEGFGNGRVVRNLFEEAISNQAMRLCADDREFHGSDLATILEEDFPFSAYGEDKRANLPVPVEPSLPTPIVEERPEPKPEEKPEPKPEEKPQAAWTIQQWQMLQFQQSVGANGLPAAFFEGRKYPPYTFPGVLETMEILSKNRGFIPPDVYKELMEEQDKLLSKVPKSYG